jgi:hypothetical protein
MPIFSRSACAVALIALMLGVVAGCSVHAGEPVTDTSFCDGSPHSFPYNCGTYQMNVTICSTAYKVEACVPYQSQPRIVIYDGWIVIEGTLPPWPVAGTPDTIIGGPEGDPPTTMPTVRACLVRIDDGEDAAFFQSKPYAPAAAGDMKPVTIKGTRFLGSSRQPEKTKGVVNQTQLFGNKFVDLVTTVPPQLEPIEDKHIRQFRVDAHREANP